MNIPHYQINTFTNQLCSGNAAGVCILADWLPDTLLQNIATENNLSETAFIVNKGDYYDLRWFTPSIEMDLCGHATLAAAYVLYQHLGFNRSCVQFKTLSGILTVSYNGNLLTLDFPARLATPCLEIPPDLIKGLGASPLYVAKARDYLAVFDSEETVANIKPDFELLARLDCLGIIVTAASTADKNYHVVSRFFAPSAGINEDPVTGSAHCTLIPYWADKLQQKQLYAKQISKHGGDLFCEYTGDRVLISGHAITYMTGFICV